MYKIKEKVGGHWVTKQREFRLKSAAQKYARGLKKLNPNGKVHVVKG